MNRSRIALLICLGLVLAASITHVASSFGSLEDGQVVGWLAALGIDAGIAVLMWRLMTGRTDRPRWSKAGVLLMALVSAWANLDHALSVAIGEDNVSGALSTWHGSPTWQVARVLMLSITLPVLTVILAAVVEGEQTDEQADGERAPYRPPVLVEVTPRRLANPRERSRVGSQSVPTGDQAAVLAYAGEHPEATQREISDATGVPRSTVGRWLKAVS